jgi:Pyruvate/2-oxoacid:ferredoxin oxidoreductase delta subunit
MSFAADNCICPRCGGIIPHRPGVPCYKTACPNCGSLMTRQFNVSAIEGPGRAAGGPAAVKPAVDQDACTGCQECVAVCPETAIEMRDGKAHILSAECSNCRICIPACPEGAIR